ncbi:unnamed protein product [Rhizophagus irregularis]|nr:unnamed protein product [Rhizophagus irregularis]
MQKQNGMSSCTETFLSIFTSLQFCNKNNVENGIVTILRRKSKNAKAKRDEFLHFIMEPREAYIERNTFCNDDDQNEGGVKISEAIGKNPLRALFYGCGRTHTIYKGLRLTLI